MGGAVDLLQCGLGLLMAAALTVALLYGLHPELYTAVGQLCAAPPSPPKPPPEHEERQTTTAAAADDGGPPPPDVLEYTPTTGGTTRVRILHPQNAETLARLRDEARSDPDVLTQMTVTSSAQYPDVSPERPLLINTYRRTVAV